jgi:hypothetical protein
LCWSSRRAWAYERFASARYPASRKAFPRFLCACAKFGSKRRGAPATFERRGDVQALEQQLAQVRVGFAVGAFRLDRAPEGCNGIISLAEQAERIPKVVMRLLGNSD